MDNLDALHAAQERREILEGVIRTITSSVMSDGLFNGALPQAEIRRVLANSLELTDLQIRYIFEVPLGALTSERFNGIKSELLSIEAFLEEEAD